MRTFNLETGDLCLLDLPLVSYKTSLHLFETWGFVKQGQYMIIRKWSKAIPTAVPAQAQVDEANLRLLEVINSTLSQLLKH